MRFTLAAFLRPEDYVQGICRSDSLAPSPFSLPS